MHKHHIIPRSRGGGDEAENIQLLSPYDHALHHAIEFIEGGPWFDFRHEGWPLLPKEIKNRVLNRASQYQKENPIGKYERTSTHRDILRFARSTEERKESCLKMRELVSHKRKEIGQKAALRCLELGVGLYAPENLGKGAKTTNSIKWMDPEHPELGCHHFNKLKKLQRQHGYPDGKENRVKAPIEGS